LLLPFDKPGLIVIDEEHDGSYKQSDSGSLHEMPGAFSLYHARRGGGGTARPDQCHCDFGPSAHAFAEAWSRAQRGEYKLLTLARRVLGHAQVIHAQGEQYHIAAKSYHPAEAELARYTRLPRWILWICARS